jgi:hypothetical protein
MKARNALALILPVLVTATGFAQTAGAKSSAQAERASVAGVWRAQADGLPFITLTLTHEGGRLEGAVLFYMHRREPGGQVTSSPGIPEPLLNLRFDGKSAIFAVSHRHAHPPTSLSTPPVHFRMDLTDASHASLVNQSEPGPSAVLVRSD